MTVYQSMSGIDLLIGTSDNDSIIVTQFSNDSGDVFDGAGAFDVFSLVIGPGYSFALTTYDFRGAKISSIEGINFVGAGNNREASFYSSQFGAGLSNNLSVSGSDLAQRIIVTMDAPGSFSAALWTFANWSNNTSQIAYDDLVVISGSSGADVITGSSSVDYLYGNAGDDTIHSGSGYDTLDGGAGNDNLDGGGGGDTLYGGDGDDTLYGGDEPTYTGNYLYGGAGNDHLVGGQWSNYMLGDDGNDYLQGGIGRDVLIGGSGDDILDGGDGVDVIAGGEGVDQLFGGAGDDILTLKDLVSGTIVSGGNGSDQIQLFTDFPSPTAPIDLDFSGFFTAMSQGNDFVLHGVTFRSVEGILVNFSQYDDHIILGTDYTHGYVGGARFDLRSGDDQFVGSGVGDFATGGDGNDYLNGGGGDDNLYGGADDDFLDGGKGNDVLNGGDGIDFLDGGDGFDFLDGGDGSDILVGNSPVSGPLQNDLRDRYFGGAGFDTIRMGDNEPITQISQIGASRSLFLAGAEVSSIEIIDFASTVGEKRVVTIGAWQIGGNGLASNLGLIGGLGSDTLIITAQAGGDYTVPTFREFNWDLSEEPNQGDQIVFSAAGQESFTLRANNTHFGFETIKGAIGSDTLIGGDRDDILDGRDGNDTVSGGAGNDVLDGGAGSDTLDGGAGDDLVYWDASDGAANVSGGTGIDTLVMRDGVALPAFDFAARGFELLEIETNDLTNSLVWSRQTQTYNLALQLTNYSTLNDDGSHVDVALDPGNANGTAQVVSYYDTLDRLVQVDQVNDDASRVIFNYDPANASTLTSQALYFDAQGRFDVWDQLYDDGRHVIINYDQGNVEALSSEIIYYDAQARLDLWDRYFDDGSLFPVSAHGTDLRL